MWWIVYLLTLTTLLMLAQKRKAAQTDRRPTTASVRVPTKDYYVVRRDDGTHCLINAETGDVIDNHPL